MPLTLDPARTALLLLDYQHDNITATPGLTEARVLEHSARVLEAEYLKTNGETIRKFNRALHKASTWLPDNPAEAGVASMKQFLRRLDDKVILDGLQKTRLGIPARRASASARGSQPRSSC